MDFFKHYNKQKWKVSDANCTITRIGAKEATCYGNKIISSDTDGIHRWKFKLNNKFSGYGCIGIDEANYKWMDTCFHNRNDTTIHYALYGDGAGKLFGPDGQKTTSVARSFREGDVVEMILDLNTKSLSFCINNSPISPKKAFDIKQTKIGYCMAIYLNRKDEAITLISYDFEKNESELKSNEDANHRNKLQKLTAEILRLKQELKAARKINGKNMEENNTLSAQNKSLNGVINSTLDEAKRLRQHNTKHQAQVQQLQQTNTSLQSTINSTTDEVKKLQSTIAILKDEVGGLQDEQKEYEMEINKLRTENKQLKLKSIDESKYIQWDHESILLWIMSLDNGRYLKYEDILHKNLKHEEVIGENLKDVDAIDIKGWGVSNFGDKKSLLQQIQRLVNQNNINEGGNAATAFI